MTRECIHGKPFHTCTICKHVKNLLNHNTIIATKAQMMYVGMRSSNFNRSMNMVRVSQLGDTDAVRRVTITPAVRNAANAYFRQPSRMSSMILREGLLIAMTPSNRLLSMPDTPTSFTPASTISPRFSRSALSVYSRMGTPDSPTVNRRARSVTPMSTRRPTPTPHSNSNSNQNSVLRISAPKRLRKS